MAKKGGIFVCVPCGMEIVITESGAAYSEIICCGEVMEPGAKEKAPAKKSRQEEGPGQESGREKSRRQESPGQEEIDGKKELRFALPGTPSGRATFFRHG